MLCPPWCPLIWLPEAINRNTLRRIRIILICIEFGNFSIRDNLPPYSLKHPWWGNNNIFVVALKSSWSSYFAGNWTKHWLAWCIIRSTSAGLPSTESWSSSAQSVPAKMKKKTFEIFQPLTPAARIEFNNLCWIKRGESLMKKKSWQDFAKLFWRKLTNSFWKK